MTVTWILIANASRAHLYANEGPRQGLKRVGDFAHPESREHASALVTDRQGQFGPGNKQGAFVGPDPKQYESHRFAQELAGVLEEGRTGNRYARLIVAASPAFLGQLNECLSLQVSQLVTERIKKDYTQADTRALSDHLQQYIYL